MSCARTSYRAVVTAFLCAAIFQAADAQAQLADSTWPMYMHDAKHTGQAPVNGPSTNSVRVLWTYKAASRIKTSPTIGRSQDGSPIYIGAGFAPLCSINSSNGAQNWCTVGGGDAAVSSPTAASDGTIYIGARDNKLWSVTHDGIIKWRYKIFFDGDIKSSPLLDPSGGEVYAACGCLTRGTVLSLDRNTANPNGELGWELQVSKSVRTSAPALNAGGDTLYVGSTDGNLHALKTHPAAPPSGELLWSTKVGGVNTDVSSPSIASNGTIYIGTNTGLAAVAPNGQIAWTFSANDKVSATAAIATNGTLYFGTKKGTFYALNPNGTLKWQIAGLGEFRSSPAIGANGKIYAAGGKNVYCFNDNGANGSIQWTFVTGKPIQWSSPAIGPNKTLYIGSTDHNLYALVEN